MISSEDELILIIIINFVMGEYLFLQTILLRPLHAYVPEDSSEGCVTQAVLKVTLGELPKDA